MAAVTRGGCCFTGALLVDGGFETAGSRTADGAALAGLAAFVAAAAAAAFTGASFMDGGFTGALCTRWVPVAGIDFLGLAIKIKDGLLSVKCVFMRLTIVK